MVGFPYPWPISFLPARHYINVRAYNAGFDSDADTLDMTATGNVLDSDGNDADGCEATGSVLSHKWYVLDENPEKFEIYPVIRSYDDCPPGEYTLAITVSVVSSGKSVTLKTDFTIEPSP